MNMFESELLIFAWGLALVGAVVASLVVRVVDGVFNEVARLGSGPTDESKED